MEGDRSFSFKLLVPPRVSNGQIFAVRPQEKIDKGADFTNTMSHDYTKGLNKEPSMPFPNASVVVPTKPSTQDFPRMKAVAPMEKDEGICSPRELYSKVLDEVEKMKCWKVKVDSDTMQKERKLRENKRTIETQRKAIQELQFGNESLSIKLEEQISENEDLRSKNNATRNLCHVLKETFQWSAEKMHLFETEREETHHLFMENNESIKKLIIAFDSLHIQVEADQREMQKVKEDLLQFEDLKEKYNQEYKMKEEEIAILQSKLKDKQSELQKVVLDLDETQKHCTQLQESTNQQFELLKFSKAEQESLIEKLTAAEQRCKETEKNQEAIVATLEQSKTEYGQIIQSKELTLQELSKVKNQQAEKLEHIQMIIKELNNSLTLKIQKAKELEDKLKESSNELERRSTLLVETMEQTAKKDEQIKSLEDELDMKSKSIESLKGKIAVTEAKLRKLTAELSQKTEEMKMFKVLQRDTPSECHNDVFEILSPIQNEAFAENDLLKKACEAAEKAQNDLKTKSTLTESQMKELEGQLFAEMTKNKESAFEMEQLRKDIMQHNLKYEELLSNFNELQSEKIAIQQHLENGFSNVKAVEANMKMSEEKAAKLKKEIQRLEEDNLCLQEELKSNKTQIVKTSQEAEVLQKKMKENWEHLDKEIGEKEKWIKAVEIKLCSLRKKFEIKFRVQDEYRKENKMLKKQLAKEIAKASELENMGKNLNKESENFKNLKEEEHRKLLKELDSKSTFAAELENEVKKLRITTAESIKNKEDTELKCQQKIGDMVTLMEKHKSQYDRMVEAKDAVLEENRKKEMEAVSQAKSLELDLSKQKTENDQLKKMLKTETTEKENLQKELADLKREMSVVNTSQSSQAKNKQSTDSKYKTERCADTPERGAVKSSAFDFFRSKMTPSFSKDHHFNSEDMKTPGSITRRVGGTSKIKSYRIRTPPSDEKIGQWGKSTIELDPKSDSDDQNDLFAFASGPSFSGPQNKLSIVKKIYSPAVHKSPGNSLKAAAVKRMRDAGWTAVTGCDKKKKTLEKIFA
ncbi:synaptonemal complex protein 1 [Pholidichthys leucotaenia]